MTAAFHKVGMGMPVYNGETYLEETLRTTLAQTYDDFSLTIADNASTDRTREICMDFASSDSRINYIRNPVNLGAAKNYAVCFEPANCEYFRWANADDLADLTLVEKCVPILDENPDTVLVYGKTRIIGTDGEFLEDYDDKMNLRADSARDRFVECLNELGLSNILYGLMRREQLAKTALMGNYMASDLNLIAELTLYGKFYELPETLFSRRMHPEASSWDRADLETQRQFWDPSKPRLFLQKWRRVYEYYRAIYRSPAPAADKLAMSGHMLKRIYWWGQPLSQEIADYLRYGVIKR